MAKKGKKQPVGRPRLDDSAAMRGVAIRFPEPMLVAIDEIITDKMGAVDRATVIREAVAEYIQRYRQRRG